MNPGILDGVAKFLSIMFILNSILFLFNLIPIPPLDGNGIIPMYLSEEKGRKYLETLSNRAFGFIGILIAWKLFDLIYFQMHTVIINILYLGSNYH